MQVIAESNYTLGLPPDGPRYVDKFDPLFAEFEQMMGRDLNIKKLSGYHKVIPTVKNFTEAWMKHDVPAVVPKTQLLKTVIQRVSKYMNYLECEVNDYDEMEHEYSLNTASGLPFSKLGYKKKIDAFTEGGDILTDLCSRYDYIPVNFDASKVELLSEEELRNNKLRDIKVACLPHLMAQKIIYDKQNAFIIAEHARTWIKYGVCKQYGGFHRMIKPLEKFDLRHESDGSRWDKRINLEPTYQVRENNIRIHRKLEELYQWAKYFVLNPYVLLPNGKVVRLKTGNMSGGNNTTPDNCIAHFIIRIYLYATMLLRAYPEKDWSFSEIFDHACECIYSDDKLGSLDSAYFKVTLEEYKQLEKEVYALFGIEIKESSFLMTKGPGRIDPRHSFLGSYCTYDEFYQKYIPSPRFDKVCASMVLEPINSIEDPINYFQRILNLVILTYPREEVFSEGVKYLTFLYEHKKFKRHQWRLQEILDMNEVDLDSRQSFERLYLGLESQ